MVGVARSTRVFVGGHLSSLSEAEISTRLPRVLNRWERALRSARAGVAVGGHRWVPRGTDSVGDRRGVPRVGRVTGVIPVGHLDRQRHRLRADRFPCAGRHGEESLGGWIRGDRLPRGLHYLFGLR